MAGSPEVPDVSLQRRFEGGLAGIGRSGSGGQSGSLAAVAQCHLTSRYHKLSSSPAVRSREPGTSE